MEFASIVDEALVDRNICIDSDWGRSRYELGHRKIEEFN